MMSGVAYDAGDDMDYLGDSYCVFDPPLDHLQLLS